MDGDLTGSSRQSDIPAGWYAHPDDARKWMYWDGSGWDLGKTAPRNPSVTGRAYAVPQPAPAQLLQAAARGAVESQDRTQIDKLRRSGPLRVLLGLGFAIGASIFGINSASEGNGVIWTGGYLVAGILVYKGWSRYRVTRRAGLPNPEGWMVALIGVAALAATYAGWQYWTVFSNGGFREGSCVSAAGELVLCQSSNATYVVTDLTDSRENCPDWSGVIDNGTVICFERK